MSSPIVPPRRDTSRPSYLLSYRNLFAEKCKHGSYSKDIKRFSTELEHGVLNHIDEASCILEEILEEEEVVDVDDHKVDMFIPDSIKGAVFCGHIMTDMDSIGGAIGAASLFGGTPASASEINSETKFALEKFGLPVPRRIEEIIAEDPDTKVCLVDHQQTTQLNPSIKEKNIVGIIDHHALQNKTLVTEKPIFVDIRPWGSMSSMIAHYFLVNKKRPSRSVAGVLLCAILSDTLNLKSPTTSEWDKLIVTILAELAEVEDIDDHAKKQFHAKSKELKNLSAYSLVHGDIKSFSFNQPGGFEGNVTFAVIETTDDEAILTRVDEIVGEMKASKKEFEKKSDLLFVAIVNIVDFHSHVILCGPGEISLAKHAFPDGQVKGPILMDTGSRVSRKKEFIPTLTASIQSGWKMDVELPEEDDKEPTKLIVDPDDPFGQVRRISAV